MQYFALLPAKQGNRARADWVVLSRDSSSRFGPAVANWFVDRDSVIRVLFYDVDWGYRMALRPVTKDSLEGFVHFDWEIGPDPQARLRGQRIACPPDFN